MRSSLMQSSLMWSWLMQPILVKAGQLPQVAAESIADVGSDIADTANHHQSSLIQAG
jgi:hypothetical protein